MAKIYISYTHDDKELTLRISEELQNRGHQILMDSLVLKVGQDWRKVLLDSVKAADGVIVLITEKSLKSNYLISEIGTARAFVGESSNKKFLIPLIYGDIPIPNFIEDLICIRIDEDNFIQSINTIDESISSFFGRKEAVEEKETKVRQQIESKAADYIKEATLALGKRERQNKAFGMSCYIIGFITLVVGILVVINGLQSLNTIQVLLDKHPNQIIGIYTLAILKSILIIGLLVACSKYAFTLGKSFMHETLKNADRIHAISFGEFYLKAFSDKIDSPADIKEIFQHWNIDKSSSFLQLDSNSYDPKFMDSLVEIIKNLSLKKDDK